MNAELSQKIEQIINVTGLTNKWLMWCEQRLPNQSTFVSPIYQMRDAFSHVVTMFTLGFEDQGVDEKNVLDAEELFASTKTMAEFSEVLSHCFRAFFDIADYIVEELTKESIEKTAKKGERKKAGVEQYHLLKGALVSYNERILDLRSNKSNPSDMAYKTVEEWDQILQFLTSSYAFSDLESEINEKYRELYNMILTIEEHFDPEVITTYDAHFFEDKLQLAALCELPVGYKKFQDKESPTSEQNEDPSKWQASIQAEFEDKKTKLDERYKHCKALLNEIPASAFFRRVRNDRKSVTGFLEGLLSAVLSAVISIFLGKECFIPANTEEMIVSAEMVLNRDFFLKFLILFLLLWLASFFLLELIKRIAFWIYKKYRTHKIK